MIMNEFIILYLIFISVLFILIIYYTYLCFFIKKKEFSGPDVLGDIPDQLKECSIQLQLMINKIEAIQNKNHNLK